MKSRSQSTTSLKDVLVILLGVFGVAAAGVSAAADQLGWKIVPDPEIVNFKRADAKVVTQTLVAPPFLPEHTQVASGPPRIVKIRMDIVEREVEIAPGVFVWRDLYLAERRAGNFTWSIRSSCYRSQCRRRSIGMEDCPRP